MKTIGTKLDNSEYEIFEFLCSEKGLSKSEQLRDLIKTFIGDVNVSDDEDEKPTRTKGEIVGISIDDNTAKEVTDVIVEN